MTQIAICHNSDFIKNGFEIICKSLGENVEIVFTSLHDINSKKLLVEIDVLIISDKQFLRHSNKLIVDNGLRELLKVVVVGSYIDESSISFFYANGAHCYLKNNEGFDSIIRAIKIVLQGGVYCPYPIKLQYNNRKSRLTPTFSDRELQVINLVRKEMTNKEISEHLGLHVKTIEFHKKNVIEKCGVRNFIGALDYLIAIGIIPISEAYM